MPQLTDEAIRADRENRWWIFDGVQHRLAMLNEPKPETAEFFGEMIPVIHTIGPDPDEWVCDFCNSDIEIRADRNSPTLIPMLFSNALCSRCMRKNMTAYEVAKMIVLGEPTIWSSMVCTCSGCMDALGIAKVPDDRL